MNKLKTLIKNRNIKLSQIAEALGISGTSMTAKMQGKTRFYFDEVCIIKDMLGLTAEETFEIFADYCNKSNFS